MNTQHQHTQIVPVRGAQHCSFLPAGHSSKIQSLFQCRFIPQGLSFAGFRGRQKELLLDSLYLLQSAIYSLDKYGEETWQINGTNLAEQWERIYRCLGLWGITSGERSLLVRDIKLYQQVELGLRKGILPTALPIDRFYYLKTCDVRLSRALIARHSPDRRTEEFLYPLWACFDLAGEIYDDLTDVAEDMTTFNCNRFLIGYELQGCTRTQKEYRQFLFTIEQRMRSAFEERRGVQEAEFIYKIFSKMVQDVNALLDFYNDYNEGATVTGSSILNQLLYGRSGVDSINEAVGKGISSLHAEVQECAADARALGNHAGTQIKEGRTGKEVAPPFNP